MTAPNFQTRRPIMPALSELPATYRSSAYPISSILALAVFREVRHDPGRIVRARGLFWLSGCNIPDVRGTPRGSVGALAALAEGSEHRARLCGRQMGLPRFQTAAPSPNRPGRRVEIPVNTRMTGSRSSSALWASGADSPLDGLTVRGAPVGFRPSLPAGE
jgi:hypothetical protein